VLKPQPVDEMHLLTKKLKIKEIYRITLIQNQDYSKALSHNKNAQSGKLSPKNIFVKANRRF